MENGALLAKLAPKFDDSGYPVSPIRGIVDEDHILICDKSGIRSVTFSEDTQWRGEMGASYVSGVGFCADGGLIAANVEKSGYLSSELTLMKYHEGYGLKEVMDFDNYVPDLLYSPEETCYAVRIAKSSYQEMVCFRRAEDDSLVGEWPREEEEGYHVASEFLDECVQKRTERSNNEIKRTFKL